MSFGASCLSKAERTKVREYFRESRNENCLVSYPSYTRTVFAVGAAYYAATIQVEITWHILRSCDATLIVTAQASSLKPPE